MRPHLLTLLTLGLVLPAHAEDWGAYAIFSASAPDLVLEAPKPAARLTVGKVSGQPNQKWTFVPKGGDFYSIRSVASPELALTAAQAGLENGTPLMLETDTNRPEQLWRIVKQADGSFSFLPKHTNAKGIDHLGGVKTPGAKIDLWAYNANDKHLQWLIKPLAGSAIAAPATPEAATYTAPEIAPDKIQKGDIRKFVFTDSKIFPGTVRDVVVFVPAQYDAAKPACVYVKTDGYNPKEKELLETLIATGEIPVCVGIFVRPGDTPAPMKGTVGRRNRCLEYDGVGDANARFLVEELLPYIAKEQKLNLSVSGNDRCISGGSSGAIAAFTAAWERPEWFSRVYANSGSFVAFRGGHEYPTLVRKYEAKPIRAYLTTGMRDMENCAGDWFLLDQEMDKAMKFSGYDYRFRIINGGHVAGYYDHHREAMAFIWKDWPTPVAAGTSAPRAQDVLLPGEGWQLFADQRPGILSPTPNAAGEIFFIDTQTDRIQRIGLDGRITDFADAAQANALSVGAKGELYAASSQTGKMIAYDTSGHAAEIISGLKARQILALPKGGLYASGDGADEGVWWVKDGKKTLVDPDLKHATGLALRPDQWILAAADGQSKWAYSYQTNADGSLTHKEKFFWLHVSDWDDNAGTAGAIYAKEGQLILATRAGLQICADDGPTQVILPFPDHARALGVALGGKDQDLLFAFTADRIWCRKVKVHASGAFSPWTKINGTRL
jgi:enterochelin esterase-like enzyme/sugar lactone lactonase YvrE